MNYREISFSAGKLRSNNFEKGFTVYLFIFIGEHSSLHSACSDLFLTAKTSSPLYRQVLQQEFVLSSLAVIQVSVKSNQFYESNQFILSEKGLSLKMLADSLGLLQLSEHIFNKSTVAAYSTSETTDVVILRNTNVVVLLKRGGVNIISWIPSCLHGK